ncbi:hypothetical protein J6500_27095 [Bradyrhizobium sp. WSM 1704]|uniref:hypothetical protein n=1 Tax=Bradyrhizobium semiaridum TaxID=2821404 RepID=UPI001CE38A0B|nr:hypothetical protein [Bradyrhizobium semiaridum]MCA6125535.1 hypothetical protein [Bradyrhizobium semiaridum]
MHSRVHCLPLTPAGLYRRLNGHLLVADLLNLDKIGILAVLIAGVAAPARPRPA